MHITCFQYGLYKLLLFVIMKFVFSFSQKFMVIQIREKDNEIVTHKQNNSEKCNNIWGWETPQHT